MVHHYKPQRGGTYAIRLPQNEITNEMEFQTTHQEICYTLP